MIPKNAITMLGDIDQCWLFAYRVPLGQVASLVPEPLQCVQKDGFGFINIVVSQLSHMRPHPLPRVFGMSYWHVAYRVPVVYGATNGETIEGLYFLRSDADSSLMVGAGNLLTDFRFHRSHVNVIDDGNCVDLSVPSNEASINIRMDRKKQPVLASGSPFASLDEAQAFLKYKPTGISVGTKEVNVMRITRDESAWKSRLLHVADGRFRFLRSFDATLEVCYEVEPIRYRWNQAERFNLS